MKSVFPRKLRRHLKFVYAHHQPLAVALRDIGSVQHAKRVADFLRVMEASGTEPTDMAAFIHFRVVHREQYVGYENNVRGLLTALFDVANKTRGRVNGMRTGAFNRPAAERLWSRGRSEGFG